MTNKAKNRIRDIQHQSGWGYQFCHFLVSKLGYDTIYEALDNTPKENYAELGIELNKKAKSS